MQANVAQCDEPRICDQKKTGSLLDLSMSFLAYIQKNHVHVKNTTIRLLSIQFLFFTTNIFH